MSNVKSITLLDGKVCLRAPHDQTNPPEDGIWLAAAVQARPGETLLEAGIGTGCAALCLAHRQPEVRQIYGLDINHTVLTTAQHNLGLNASAPAVSLIQGNILSPPFEPGYFDHVYANPPFHLREQGFASPDPMRALAYGADGPEMLGWLEAMLALTHEDGTVTMIHHAANARMLLDAIGGRFPTRIAHLQTGREAPSKRIIIQVRKHTSRNNTAKLSRCTVPAWQESIRHHILYDGGALEDCMAQADCQSQQV